VTCGAVNALVTMAAAICLRTPRTGILSSRPVPAPFETTDTERTVVSPAARCTSSRVTEPPGPVPASSARLTPRSLASRRTGGLAAARAADTGGTGDCGPVGTSAVSGRPAAAAIAGTVLRARRVVDEALTP
jgi:hypothetical protein